MEKRLGAALIAGDRIISIDNCERPLGGELLCQALTQRILKPRVLVIHAEEEWEIARECWRLISGC